MSDAIIRNLLKTDEKRGGRLQETLPGVLDHREFARVVQQVWNMGTGSHLAPDLSDLTFFFDFRSADPGRMGRIWEIVILGIF
ncbi:hypothetical protein E2N92_00990 [Methanofollis formosanus]|uniref:Uncharacterized protein n=1 Tax=Methanofollis formosanus TaxID=299308 RepID=A0A8G1EFF7_9EURY|nr:hypothetical protein [Methanofollis formosanus]QYZ78104.1 hypothetical protein E2N92_00990 [Methanofollis formosanus]